MAMLLGLAACAGGSDSTAWRGSVDTLPNGAIRVASSAQGAWRPGSAWRLVPELRLGEPDGAPAYVFSTIAGLTADDEGRIYVLDRQANELRIFDRTAKLLGTAGRTGGGPGEFQGANGLAWLAADTLVVVDQQGERYTVLTREGRYVRTVPRQLLFYGWVFSGGIVGGRIYEDATVGRTRDDRRPALLGTSLRGEGSPPGRDTVLVPKPPASAVETFGVRTERGSMWLEVPFAPRPVSHLDAAGNLWLSEGSPFRVTRTSLAGDTSLVILLDVEPAPVTDAEVAEWERGQGVRQLRAMGGRVDQDRIPKVKPHLDGLAVAPDGHLWVSLPTRPLEVAFAVFDPAGRYMGRLEASGVRRDPFVPPVVRGDRLYLAGQDEGDLPRVFVFRIDR